MSYLIGPPINILFTDQPGVWFLNLFNPDTLPPPHPCVEWYLEMEVPPDEILQGGLNWLSCPCSMSQAEIDRRFRRSAFWDMSGVSECYESRSIWWWWRWRHTTQQVHLWLHYH